jgi:hypothetical protein
MERRIDYLKAARGVYEAMLVLEKYLHQCGLEQRLTTLLNLRAGGRTVPGAYEPAKRQELRRGA